jgi:rod shape determining protein RodA
VIGIACFGVLMVYSASRDKLQASGADPNFYLKRQAAFVFVGIVVMVLMSAIDYRKLRDYAVVLYGASIFILLAVFSPVGKKSKGAQAWFQIGSYQLEPSEFAKIGLIVALAALCAHYRGRLGLRQLSVILVLSAVPFALIYKQPDLGTALVLGAILIAVLLVAGAKPRHLALIGVLGVLGVTAVLHFGVLHKYQKERLTAFLDPATNTQASAYNLDQSKIAIGSGRVEGKGLFRGTQTNLSYVPEQHTDFIFTAVGEQLGLVGSGLLLSLFVLMVWRIWRTASLTRDLAGALICVGVLAMIVFQVFENVGMTMGIMPIAGIPLPFMSYGGSAMICSFAAIGLVESVHMRRLS